MAAALAAENPLSMTFLSACGNASIAAAANSSAKNAINIRPRYGARKGSSARSGLSDLALGRSEDGLSLTKLESAQVQFPPHPEIAGQAVERVTESRGPVVFEVEMTHPREAVPTDQRAEQPPGIARGDQRQQAQHRPPGPDEMQGARHRVPMLGQV